MGAKIICELHVSGSGRPNFILKKSILLAGDVPPPDVQRERFRNSPFNTATRARALPDDLLKQLLPGHDVRIVRHAEIIDTDTTDVRKANSRFYASASPCYADLVLTEAVAIWTSHASPTGLVPALVIGGDRAVAGFQLNLFVPGEARPRSFRKKIETRLASPASDLSNNPERLTKSLEDAYAAALQEFARIVAKSKL